MIFFWNRYLNFWKIMCVFSYNVDNRSCKSWKCSIGLSPMLGGIGEGREGDYRGWYGWVASLTRWMWIWVNSRSWWWTGRPGVLRFMGSQRVGHDWETELNRTDYLLIFYFFFLPSFLLFLCFNDIFASVSWRKNEQLWGGLS